MPHILKTRDYALRVAARYPHLEPESVVATCTAFMQLLFGVVRTNHEVRITSKHPALSLKIYKVNFDVESVNRRARRGQSRRLAERRHRARRSFLRRELGLPPAPDLFQLSS